MIIIRNYKEEDAIETGKLIADTFGEFNLSALSPEERELALGPFRHHPRLSAGAGLGRGAVRVHRARVGDASRHRGFDSIHGYGLPIRWVVRPAAGPGSRHGDRLRPCSCRSTA